MNIGDVHVGFSCCDDTFPFVQVTYDVALRSISFAKSQSTRVVETTHDTQIYLLGREPST